MVCQILCALLVAVFIAWTLYFYRDKERTEKTEELLEKNIVLRAVNDGMVLGMSVVGIVFMALLLV